MDGFLLIAFTLLLSGFFSGAEIAFVSANRLKVEIETRKADFTARSLDFFIRSPEQFLTTTLVGNNIVNVLYATLMALFLRDPVTSAWAAVVGTQPGAAAVLAVQTLVASLFIMVLGEIIPKSIFRAQSDVLVRVVAGPLRVVHVLLRPIIVVANAASQRLVKRIGVAKQEQDLIFRRQDIEMLFRELRDTGGGEDFDKEDSAILHNVLELSAKRVRESMVPRTEIQAVDENASVRDVLQTFTASGYSKLPVFRETIDNVVGVVFAHDLFKRPSTLAEIIRPVKIIPSSKKAQDLLTEFRQTNTSVAIVIDEYGGTAGMITAEDLIEEVVGDIQDEYDTEESIIRKLTDNTYMVSASTELDDLLEAHPELKIPFGEDSEYETLAGYIIHMSGRIPKVNEELLLDGNKYIISRATPSRLDMIKIVRVVEE